MQLGTEAWEQPRILKERLRRLRSYAPLRILDKPEGGCFQFKLSAIDYEETSR